MDNVLQFYLYLNMSIYFLYVNIIMMIFSRLEYIYNVVRPSVSILYCCDFFFV